MKNSITFKVHHPLNAPPHTHTPTHIYTLWHYPTLRYLCSAGKWAINEIPFQYHNVTCLRQYTTIQKTPYKFTHLCSGSSSGRRYSFDSNGECKTGKGGLEELRPTKSSSWLIRALRVEWIVSASSVTIPVMIFRWMSSLVGSVSRTQYWLSLSINPPSSSLLEPYIMHRAPHTLLFLISLLYILKPDTVLSRSSKSWHLPIPITPRICLWGLNSLQLRPSVAHAGRFS